MDDPRSIIRGRALGILHDIPELRDSPLLEGPLSDVMLRDSDRWMAVTGSQSLALGGVFHLFPSLSSAAPFIIGDVGRIIGMWDLFRGHDYWERLIPIVSVSVKRFGPSVTAPLNEIFGFSGVASDLPSSSGDPHVVTPDLMERAAMVCDNVSVWSMDCVDRFCVKSLQEKAGHLLSFATFHPSLRDAAFEVLRHNVQVEGFHDLSSDAWATSQDVMIRGDIRVDGRSGGLNWSHRNHCFSTSFHEEQIP